MTPSKQLKYPPQKQNDTAQSPRILVRGDRIEIDPKCNTDKGTVNTITARELAAVAMGARSRSAQASEKRPLIEAVSGSAKHRKPAMAANESCRLTLAQAKGLNTRIKASAADKEVTGSFSL